MPVQALAKFMSQTQVAYHLRMSTTAIVMNFAGHKFRVTPESYCANILVSGLHAVNYLRGENGVSLEPILTSIL